MSKNTIKGFFCNKVFFVFAGLFLLVAVAYLFANDNLGGHNKGLKGFGCTPEGGSCAGGVRIFVDENGDMSDGCSKSLLTGKCSGTCYWCEPSNDKGRYCKEMMEYSGTCVVPVPVSTMSCGPRRPHTCKDNGGHGISGCCPEKNTDIPLGEACSNIATCIDIVD